ncbi:unnamed protein product [Closterium sp. Naga37s-1]|nr:unnamed protein product [Closterium sp. Naga37s-1]
MAQPLALCRPSPFWGAPSSQSPSLSARCARVPRGAGVSRLSAMRAPSAVAARRCVVVTASAGAGAVDAGAEAVEIEAAVAVLAEAARSKQVKGEAVFAALRRLETRKVGAEESKAWLAALGGAASPGHMWQLVFTAGSGEVRKAAKGGEGTGSYFPIPAIQRFDATAMEIENGVFLGPVGYLTFQGPMGFTARRLAFTFHTLTLKLGPLPPFQWGIGKEEDKGRVPGEGKAGSKDPFFTWFYVDDHIAAARGRGGGAAFWVEGRVVAEIGAGLCVLVGVMAGDGEQDCDYMCRKILNLRLWPNEKTGKAWDQSVSQRGYEVLLVSQFTLYGQPKGNKIDFHVAMPPQQASAFYDAFLHRVRRAYHPDRVKALSMLFVCTCLRAQLSLVCARVCLCHPVSSLTCARLCTARPSTADGIFGAMMEVSGWWWVVAGGGEGGVAHWCVAMSWPFECASLFVDASPPRFLPPCLPSPHLSSLCPPSSCLFHFVLDVQVHIANSGPVTLFLDSRKQSSADGNGGTASKESNAVNGGDEGKEGAMR